MLPTRWRRSPLSVVGCAPEDVRIGIEVRATFERLTDEIALLQFEPAR